MVDHPDLKGQVAQQRLFVPPPADTWAVRHGTAMAGIIAAKNNGYGVIGVAAGARVVAMRVLDRRGSGPDSGVVAAIDYVAANALPGDVINLSLITSPLRAMDDAVAGAGAKGIYVAIAAGNYAKSASNYSPARAEGVNVFTVSAFEQGDKWAYYSNYGNPPVDYAEPGSSILSTYKNGGYSTLSGTSMAAPHLAGLLLLRGAPAVGGVVSGDPAAPADPIGVR